MEQQGMPETTKNTSRQPRTSKSREFLLQVAEILVGASGAAVGIITPIRFRESVERLATAEPKNVQEVATAQTAMLLTIYSDRVNQARLSFYAALISSALGVVILFAAVGILFTRPLEDWLALTAGVSAIGGVVAEVIAALLLLLQARTATHLSEVVGFLDGTQRYLLANSMIENLDGCYKQQARHELIRQIAAGSASADKPEGLAK